MKGVVGQSKLVQELSRYTVQNAPKTMLFIGPYGCGKTTIASKFAEQIGVDFVNVPADASAEQLLEYYRHPLPRLYFIKLVGVSEKQQNKLLKFIEEPSSNMFVVLAAESTVGVLPTILNRCVKHKFESYTSDQLMEFSWMVGDMDPLAMAICQTPGQLLDLDKDKLGPTAELCVTILEKAKLASYANMMKVASKINCKSDFDKLDFEMFFRLLETMSFSKYKETNDEFSFKLYMYLIGMQSKRLNKSIAKESYLLSFLDGAWRLAHDEAI